MPLWVYPWALACCPSIAQSWAQHTLRGNKGKAWRRKQERKEKTPDKKGNPSKHKISALVGRFFCRKCSASQFWNKSTRYSLRNTPDYAFNPTFEWSSLSVNPKCEWRSLSVYKTTDLKTSTCLHHFFVPVLDMDGEMFFGKLTWLVLGGDPAARSHRVEQLTALWGL